MSCYCGFSRVTRLINLRSNQISFDRSLIAAVLVKIWPPIFETIKPRSNMSGHIKLFDVFFFTNNKLPDKV